MFKIFSKTQRIAKISTIVDRQGLSPSLFYDDARASTFDQANTIHDKKCMKMWLVARNNGSGISMRQDFNPMNFKNLAGTKREL